MILNSEKSEDSFIKKIEIKLLFFSCEMLIEAILNFDGWVQAGKSYLLCHEKKKSQ